MKDFDYPSSSLILPTRVNEAGWATPPVGGLYPFLTRMLDSIFFHKRTVIENIAFIRYYAYVAYVTLHACRVMWIIDLFIQLRTALTAAFQLSCITNHQPSAVPASQPAQSTSLGFMNAMYLTTRVFVIQSDIAYITSIITVVYYHHYHCITINVL